MADQIKARMKVKLTKLSNKQMGYTNCVYLSSDSLKILAILSGTLLLIEEQQVFQVKEDPDLPENAMGVSGLLCKSLHLDKNSLGTMVTVQPWQPAAQNKNLYANTVSIVVDTYSKAETAIKVEELEKFITANFLNQVFCKDQRFVIKWVQYGQTYWLQLQIANVYKAKDEDANDEKKDGSETNTSGRAKRQETTRFGKINDSTTISLIAAHNIFMKLIVPPGTLLGGLNIDMGMGFDPEKLGIGGLDQQFTIIFRRAFSSRLFPPDIVKELGIKHVKGMLLFGPPGTGKTLIARSIGSMLTENEPQVINGPEVLNKYVGQSEENIRKLFQPARDDQDANGDNASLHIIIFDEIDAICKQRGSSGGSTGVHDTVVNQLLSMIDGVNCLNNVLVIGMTNRKDLLDDALLRSGRLEVHIEIGLPDEEGREQVFRIHTKSLRENGYLDDDISISELAKRTKNYTGAEIEGVVRSAVSYAMQKHIDVDNIGKMDVSKLRNIRITQEYFDMALEEVLPELGKKKIDDQLSFSYLRGIYLFNKQCSELVELCGNIVKTMNSSNLMNRQAILLLGEMGCGKTAFASYIANEVAKWAFIRIISADNYVGFSDINICSSINKIFTDAYKSKQSIIILDDLERLIGYTMGPRFSNAILQAILTCIKRNNTTDQERKILVIATCSSKTSMELELDKQFDFARDLPLVSSQLEFQTILEKSAYDQRCRPSVKDIVKVFPEKANVGIADLLTVLELAVDVNKQITPKSFLTAWNAKFSGSRHRKKDYTINLDFGDD